MSETKPEERRPIPADAYPEAQHWRKEPEPPHATAPVEEPKPVTTSVESPTGLAPAAAAPAPAEVEKSKAEKIVDWLKAFPGV